MMVPLDVMEDGCDEFVDELQRQRLARNPDRARPCVAPASNRRPPVMRMVTVMLDAVPSPPRTTRVSPVIVRDGSPWIVTLSDRQSLNSVRVDEVTVPDWSGRRDVERHRRRHRPAALQRCE